MVWQRIGRFVRSVWFFPAVLFALVCLLSVLEIHGSSVGMYNKFFYGEQYKDKDLLLGQPRGIRSDEWLVVTPMAVAQERNHFNNVNPNIGLGEDMSVVVDMPHKNWWALFQPQNWSFFVLPLEKAFAFKWWFLGFMLVSSCYAFMVSVLPRRRGFAVLISLALFFAPYVHWWYQTITIMPLAYGFLILAVLLQLLRSTTPKSRLGWAAALAYLTAAFAFVQYPPFLLPVAMGIAAFALGHVIEQWKKQGKQLKINLVYAGGAAVAAGAALVAFLVQKADVLRLVAESEYPGKRAAETMQLEWWHLVGGFFSGQLQDLNKALHYIANQSEASNFIMIAPFLLMPSAYVIYRSFKKKSAQRYTLLFLNILLVLLMLRFVTELTGSGGISSMLRIVPNNRVLLGIGFVAFLQLIVLARDQAAVTYPRWFTRGSTATVAIVLFEAGFYIATFYSEYLAAGKKLVVLIALGTLLYYLFIKKRLIAFGLLLLFLSWYSSHGIHPLYRGLDPLIHSPLSSKVTEINNKHKGTWIVLDSLEYNTYLPANGIQTLSGVYTYPQLALWQKLDPTGAYKPAYNRYSQAVFSEYAPDKIYLVQNDMFHIKFNGCDPFIQKEVDYILSVHKTSTECLSLVDTVTYPAKSFYIYKTQRAGP